MAPVQPDLQPFALPKLREVGKSPSNLLLLDPELWRRERGSRTPNPIAPASQQGMMTVTTFPQPRSPVTVFPGFRCRVQCLLVLPRGFRAGLAETLPHVFHFDNSPMVSVITQVSIKIYSCYCSRHFPQYMCIVFGNSRNHSPHPTDAVVRATPASIYQTFLLIWDFTNNHKCCSLPKISTLSFLDC